MRSPLALPITRDTFYPYEGGDGIPAAITKVLPLIFDLVFRRHTYLKTTWHYSIIYRLHEEEHFITIYYPKRTAQDGKEWLTNKLGLAEQGIDLLDFIATEFLKLYLPSSANLAFLGEVVLKLGDRVCRVNEIRFPEKTFRMTCKAKSGYYSFPDDPFSKTAMIEGFPWWSIIKAASLLFDHEHLIWILNKSIKNSIVFSVELFMLTNNVVNVAIGEDGKEHVGVKWVDVVYTDVKDLYIKLRSFGHLYYPEHGEVEYDERDFSYESFYYNAYRGTCFVRVRNKMLMVDLKRRDWYMELKLGERAWLYLRKRRSGAWHEPPFFALFLDTDGLEQLPEGDIFEMRHVSVEKLALGHKEGIV